MDTAFPVAAENTSGVSSGVSCAPGTMLYGASFRVLTLTVVVATAPSAAPSLATKWIARGVVPGLDPKLLYRTVRSTC